MSLAMFEVQKYLLCLQIKDNRSRQSIIREFNFVSIFYHVLRKLCRCEAKMIAVSIFLYLANQTREICMFIKEVHSAINIQ